MSFGSVKESVSVAGAGMEDMEALLLCFFGIIAQNVNAARMGSLVLWRNPKGYPRWLYKLPSIYRGCCGTEAVVG